MVDDQRILSMVKKNNIQSKEEPSPGGRRATVKVYNQEKTSREQIQRRVHHKVQTGPDYSLPKKHLKRQKQPEEF